MEEKIREEKGPEPRKEKESWRVGVYNVTLKKGKGVPIIAQLAVFVNGLCWVVSLAGYPTMTWWPSVLAFCEASKANKDLRILTLEGDQVWPKESIVAPFSDVIIL